MVFHCGSDLHFSKTNDVEHLFMCFLGIYICFFGEMSIQTIFHFLIGLFLIGLLVFFVVEL